METILTIPVMITIISFPLLTLYTSRQNHRKYRWKGTILIKCELFTSLLKSFFLSGTAFNALRMNIEGVSESLKEGLKERRSKLEIIEGVLFVAKNGVRKTEIVYKTNLNFARLASYIQYLEEKGLLEISGPFYKTTSRGKEFLRNYQKLKNVFLTEEV